VHTWLYTNEEGYSIDVFDKDYNYVCQVKGISEHSYTLSNGRLYCTFQGIDDDFAHVDVYEIEYMDK